MRILRGGDAKGSKVQRTLTAAQVNSVPPDARHSVFGSIPTVAWTKAARLKDRISENSLSVGSGMKGFVFFFSFLFIVAYCTVIAVRNRYTQHAS